jgi:hypothetical protein
MWGTRRLANRGVEGGLGDADDSHDLSWLGVAADDVDLRCLYAEGPGEQVDDCFVGLAPFGGGGDTHFDRVAVVAGQVVF